MRCGSFLVGLILIILENRSASAIFLVIPEDVATGFAAIYGFSPRLLFGNDHRFRYGFRFGNHADVQILYEVGPQLSTQTIQPRVRAATYRRRTLRRRPVLDWLLRAGFIKQAEFEVNYNTNECDEPR